MHTCGCVQRRSLRQALPEVALQKAPSSNLRELFLLLSSLNRLWSATTPEYYPGANTYLILSLRSTCIQRPLSISSNLRTNRIARAPTDSAHTSPNADYSFDAT